jgi:hypothetical protein
MTKPTQTMFKLIRLFHSLARPVPQNHFYSYAVAMPEQLLPILQNRLTYLLIQELYGFRYADLTTAELFDIDCFLSHSDSSEAHYIILDPRQLSLLKRFLETERGILARSRTSVPGMSLNPALWTLLSEFHLAIVRPTQLVDLSFCC